jgi:hypothetical protein
MQLTILPLMRQIHEFSKEEKARSVLTNKLTTLQEADSVPPLG